MATRAELAQEEMARHRICSQQALQDDEQVRGIDRRGAGLDAIASFEDALPERLFRNGHR